MTVTAHLISYPALPGPGSRMKLAFETQSDGAASEAFIHIIAANMMLMECDAALQVNDRFDIFSKEELSATIVWIQGSLILCQFDRVIAPAVQGTERLPGRVGPDAAFCGAGAGRRRRTSNDAMEFGKRLQRLRTERGLKQSDIADRLGVSVAAVSQWESGRMLPRGVPRIDLADCLGVGVDDLSGRQSISELRQIVSASRAEIARAAGINPHNVRISLDL